MLNSNNALDPLRSDGQVTQDKSAVRLSDVEPSGGRSTIVPKEKLSAEQTAPKPQTTDERSSPAIEEQTQDATAKQTTPTASEARKETVEVKAFATIRNGPSSSA